MLRFMGLQRVGHDGATELNGTMYLAQSRHTDATAVTSAAGHVPSTASGPRLQPPTTPRARRAAGTAHAWRLLQEGCGDSSHLALLQHGPGQRATRGLHGLTSPRPKMAALPGCLCSIRLRLDLRTSLLSSFLTLPRSLLLSREHLLSKSLLPQFLSGSTSAKSSRRLKCYPFHFQARGQKCRSQPGY